MTEDVNNIGLTGISDLSADEVEANEADPSTFWNTLGAQFRTGNTVAAFLSDNEPFDLGDRTPLSEDFFETLEPKYRPYVDAFDFDITSEEAERTKRNLDREIEDNRRIGELSLGSQIGGGVVAGLLDVPTLLTGGVGIGGSTLRAAAAKGASLGAADGVISETLLSETQETRTVADSAISIGGSALIGSVIGAGVHTFTRAGGVPEASAILSQAADDLDTARGVKAPSTVGAQQVPDFGDGLIDENFQLPTRAARVAQKLTPKFLTPNDRVFKSDSNAAKLALTELAENDLILDAVDELNLTPSAETFSANSIGKAERELYKINRMRRQSRIVGDDGVERVMSKDEFGVRVMNALSRGDFDNDPAVASATKQTRVILDRLRDDAIDAGALDENAKASGDITYSPHSWNRDTVGVRSNEFIQRLSDFMAPQLGEQIKRNGTSMTKQASNTQAEIDNIEFARLRRREEFNRRTQGEEVDLSEADIQSMIFASRNKPEADRPKSLRDFVVDRGGIWTGDAQATEVRMMAYQRPGFLKRDRRQTSAAGDNGGGRYVDEMREAAEEAGFLKEGSTPADFLDALDNDVRGTNRFYSEADMDRAEAWNAYDELLVSLDEFGIGPDGKVLRGTTKSQKEVLAQVLNKLDEMDDVRANALKDRAEEQRYRAEVFTRLSQDAEELDSLAVEVAEATQRRISGFGEVEQASTIKIPAIKRGALNERVLSVPRELFSDFMDNDLSSVIPKHVRTMTVETELTRKFGRADMKYQLEAIDREFEGKINSTKDTKEAARLIAQRREIPKAIASVRDDMRGTANAEANQGKFAGFSRGMRNFAFATDLGGVTITSMADAMKMVMAHGILPVTRGQFPTLLKGLERVRPEARRYLREEVANAGIVVENISASRMMAVGDLDNQFSTRGPIEKSMEALSRVASTASFINQWNQFWKNTAAHIYMDRMKGMAGKAYADLPKHDKDYLRLLKINSNSFARISEQINAHSEQAGFGLTKMNADSWTDADAVKIYRAAMRQDADSLIVTPKSGMKVDRVAGVNFRHPLGAMVLQYKNFAVASQQRTLLRGLQSDPTRFAIGAIGMVALAMAVDDIKAMLGGYNLSTNPGVRIMGGLDRSGLLPVYMELNNTVEKLTGFGAYRAASLPFGQDRSGSTRYRQRNFTGTLLGTGFGKVEDTAMLMQSLSGELDPDAAGLTPSSITRVKRLTPLHNNPLIQPWLNRWVVPELQEMTE